MDLITFHIIATVDGLEAVGDFLDWCGVVWCFHTEPSPHFEQSQLLIDGFQRLCWGMTRIEYWDTVKRCVMERADSKCEKCASEDNLHMHHATYEHKGDELNHLEDLVCLCARCHRLEHLANPDLSDPTPKVGKPFIAPDILVEEMFIIDQPFLDMLLKAGTIYEGAHHWLGHTITKASRDQTLLDVGYDKTVVFPM